MELLSLFRTLAYRSRMVTYDYIQLCEKFIFNIMKKGRIIFLTTHIYARIPPSITNLSIERIRSENLSQPQSSCTLYIANSVFSSWGNIKQFYTYEFR